MVLPLQTEVFITGVAVGVEQREPPEDGLVTEADVELGLGGDLALEVGYLDLELHTELVVIKFDLRKNQCS